MSPGRNYSLAHRAGAFAVHVLTASGVGFGLLALMAAHGRQFTEMFLWLGVALLVDGIDGPLIVDYLTYVLVPVYALILSGLIPAPLDLVAGAAIAIASALYFADGRMKTDDAFFRGFPAAWNLVVFYLLIGKPAPGVALGIIALLCALTFIPVPFVNPFRVTRLRILTIPLLAAWIALALAALAYDLSPPQPVWIGLLVLAVYFLGAGILRIRST